MENAVSLKKDTDTLLPACIKIATRRIIKLCDEFYLFVENEYGDIYIFKILSYVSPSDETKDMIESIFSGYSAWLNFEGALFPSPIKVGIVWIATLRKCMGCTTKEICVTCIIAAVNTIASCFPNLIPAKIMLYFSGLLIRHIHRKMFDAEILRREKILEDFLLAGSYGQI